MEWGTNDETNTLADRDDDAAGDHPTGDGVPDDDPTGDGVTGDPTGDGTTGS